MVVAKRSTPRSRLGSTRELLRILETLVMRTNEHEARRYNFWTAKPPLAAECHVSRAG
jgi:hypothetical protein